VAVFCLLPLPHFASDRRGKADACGSWIFFPQDKKDLLIHKKQFYVFCPKVNLGQK
jgi:hypothetical protein